MHRGQGSGEFIASERRECGRVLAYGLTIEFDPSVGCHTGGQLGDPNADLWVKPDMAETSSQHNRAWEARSANSLGCDPNDPGFTEHRPHVDCARWRLR